jgi:glycosyltransferase involved in cell wall biosynthesis
MNDIKEIQKKSKNKIILHWWMDNKSAEYTTILWKSMMYCLPSISESGSLSILEWMSCESTIITTNMWVCTEMAKDIGYYINPTTKSIKKQLEYLIKNYKICEGLWKKARIKAINNYDKNVTTWKYIELCKKYL